MVSTLFRDPQALSSDLASLGTLQPRAFGSLNRVETLDSASNYYIVLICKRLSSYSIPSLIPRPLNRVWLEDEATQLSPHSNGSRMVVTVVATPPINHLTYMHVHIVQ